MKQAIQAERINKANLQKLRQFIADAESELARDDNELPASKESAGAESQSEERSTTRVVRP